MSTNSSVNSTKNCVISTKRKKEDVHKKLINGDYICDICQIMFERKNTILRYVMSKHSFHRPFRRTVKVLNISTIWRCIGLYIKRWILILYIAAVSAIIAEERRVIWKHTTSGDTPMNTNSPANIVINDFKIEWDLKFHLGTHIGSQHLCDICGRFCTSNYSLYKHRKMAHLNEYKFHCDICNKKLLTQRNLDNHMQQHKR